MPVSLNQKTIIAALLSFTVSGYAVAQDQDEIDNPTAANFVDEQNLNIDTSKWNNKKIDFFFLVVFANT